MIKERTLGSETSQYQEEQKTNCFVFCLVPVKAGNRQCERKLAGDKGRTKFAFPSQVEDRAEHFPSSGERKGRSPNPGPQGLGGCKIVV